MHWDKNVLHSEIEQPQKFEVFYALKLSHTTYLLDTNVIRDQAFRCTYSDKPVPITKDFSVIEQCLNHVGSGTIIEIEIKECISTTYYEYIEI